MLARCGGTIKRPPNCVLYRAFEHVVDSVGSTDPGHGCASAAPRSPCGAAGGTRVGVRRQRTATARLTLRPATRMQGDHAPELAQRQSLDPKDRTLPPRPYEGRLTWSGIAAAARPAIAWDGAEMRDTTLTAMVAVVVAMAAVLIALIVLRLVGGIA